MRKRRIRCSKAFLDFTRDTLRLVGDRSATMAATSVFPLPRCIVSSSSRFRAPRRKLQNTNICSSCRPDILMRLRPTYATILCFKRPPTLFWHTSDFFLGQLFFISLSSFFNRRVFFNLKQFRYLKHSVLLRLKKLLNVIFYTRPFHCPHWVAIITLIQWNRSGVIPIVRHFVRFLENTLTNVRTSTR